MITYLIILINIVRYIMRASAKTRYAMEAMVDMAIQAGDSPVALREIARRQEISQNYLEQIFMQLRAAGFVRSVRGAGGGFVLGRSPSAIRMAEIAKVFEGPIDLIGCASDTDRCSRSGSCAVRRVWIEVGECMKKALDSVTLQDVADLQAGKEAGAAPTEDKWERE
jgi:Rrf2 family cysteine metabolism transcriptional repressor